MLLVRRWPMSRSWRLFLNGLARSLAHRLAGAVACAVRSTVEFSIVMRAHSCRRDASLSGPADSASRARPVRTTRLSAQGLISGGSHDGWCYQRFAVDARSNLLTSSRPPKCFADNQADKPAGEDKEC